MSSFHAFIYLWIGIAVSLKNPRRSKRRISRCEPIQHGLDFEFDKFPRRYKLPFCQQYKKSCCKPSDSHRIFNAMKPLLIDDDISSKCKQISTDTWCSSCNPDIGIGQIIGICITHCNEWFKQCRDEYYYFDILDKLKPCTQESIVCSPLHSFISNGTEFCKASGFNINHIYLYCFDGEEKEHSNSIKKDMNMINMKMLNTKQTEKKESDKKKKKKKEKNKKREKREKNKKNKKNKKKKKKEKKSKRKDSPKSKQLKSLKKRLRDNQQSPVPWLESTIPDSSANTKKRKDKKKLKAKSSNNKNLYN